MNKRNFSFSLIFSPLLIFLVLKIFFLVSCRGINEFTIGDDFIETQTKMKILDTFKVDLSTILLDSLTTSSTGVALAGSFKDEEFGVLNCETYFDVAFQSFTDIAEGSIFDSAAIIMCYNGYSYGDTMSLMSISAHSLTESITVFDNGYLYNNSSFDYLSENTGMLQFFPTPNSSDTTISIPINKLGEEIFLYILNHDEQLTTQQGFSDYLKGFVIRSFSMDNNAVIGFKADGDHLLLRIYYHLESGLPEVEEYQISIIMGESENQFNNINYDLTNTSLKRIKSEGNEISTIKTGNRAFLQALVGLLPKFKFPTVHNILMEDRWKILKAELIFEPVKGSYELFSLPNELYVYETDKYNRINSIYTDEDDNAVVSSLFHDEIFEEQTRYTFDITTYITEELSDAYFDAEHSLLIGLEQESFISCLERLVIEGAGPAPKLRVYFLSY